MKTEHAVCAIVAGLGVGMLLGVVVAPRSGKRTQALLKQKTLVGLDQLADKGKAIGAEIDNALEAGKQAYKRAATRG